MYRIFTFISLFLTSMALVHAQDTLKVSNSDGDKLKLSNKFMSELDNAFNFSPIAAPIVPNDNTLTVDLLHEWVGDPLNLKDCCKWNKSMLVKITGLENIGKPITAPTEGIGCTVCFDFNALGKYLRPDEIRIREMREIADKNRNKMDKFYPTQGTPIYSIIDAHEADSCYVNSQ